MRISNLFILLLFTIISTNLVNAAYDLSNYPSPFIRNGNFNGVIVVGDKAPAEDVIAVSDIISSLQYARVSSSNGQTTVQRINVGAAKLASEVPDVKAQNTILVGGPCVNAATATVMGNPADCTFGYEPGVGLIEAYENPSGTISIIVSGYTENDVRNAATVLSNYGDYSSSLKGTKVRVVRVNDQLAVQSPFSANQNIVQSSSYCGDRICQSTESCTSCPSDCGKCIINTDPFGTSDVSLKISKNQASSYISDANTAINSAKQKIQKGEDAIEHAVILGLDITLAKNQIAAARIQIDSAVSDYQGASSMFNSATDKVSFDNAGYIAKSAIASAKEAETLATQAYDEITKVSSNIQTKVSGTDSKNLDINSVINQGKKLTNSLKEKQQIKFNILGEDHSMTIDKVTQNSATLTFSSTPLTFVIELLKTIIVDINQDGKGDLAVTLKSISNGIADLEFSQPSGNEQITKPINKATTPIINFNANMKYIVIGIFTLVVLISGGYGLITIYKKRPKRAKEEKTEEEPKEVIERPAISKSADAISVSGFSLKHGKNAILDNVSFEIKRGELVCLLGPSGTGKSTIIESLVGRKTPDKGTIKILGDDIRKNKRIMDYVGFVPQGAEIYMNQTAEQNLLTSATKWGIKDAKKKAERILSDINLTQRANIEAKKLSGGQQKLLSLGMELIREPELLILDEPTTGLDPNTRNNIITIISQIVAQRHKTALFTTHFMDDAEECDNVIILADKKIVAQGNPSKLKKMLPGTGRILNVILDNVTDDLLNKIKKIESIKEIIREGRSLKIITEEPNAVKLGQKIDELGGVVNKTEIVNATMKEVFVYFTGKQPEE